MRAFLILIVGCGLGFFLGATLVSPAVPTPSDPSSPELPDRAADLNRPVPRPVATRQPEEVALSRSEGSRPIGLDREQGLLRRIESLEAQLAEARTTREPRLASDRFRAREILREAIAREPLRYASFYRELSDFVAVPALLGEHSIEFVDCLERLVIASRAYGAPRIAPESSKRLCKLETSCVAELTYSRFMPSVDAPTRKNGVSVRLSLPDSLPLGHSAHLEYSFYAEFGDDGLIDYATVARQKLSSWSLTRSSSGELRCTMPSSTDGKQRSLQDVRRIHVALSAVAERLARLGS